MALWAQAAPIGRFDPCFIAPLALTRGPPARTASVILAVHMAFQAHFGASRRSTTSTSRSSQHRARADAVPNGFRQDDAPPTCSRILRPTVRTSRSRRRRDPAAAPHRRAGQLASAAPSDIRLFGRHERLANVRVGADGPTNACRPAGLSAPRLRAAPRFPSHRGARPAPRRQPQLRSISPCGSPPVVLAGSPKLLFLDRGRGRPQSRGELTSLSAYSSAPWHGLYHIPPTTTWHGGASRPSLTLLNFRQVRVADGARRGTFLRHP